MNLSLTNKTAVICGSSQGIGLAIAKELAQLGADCILLARNEATLQDAIVQLATPMNQQHQYTIADFTNTQSVQQVIENIVAKQPVHILINNTGGPAAGPIIEAAEDAFLNTFQQHLIANHILTKAVVPGMKSGNYGRIINIISTSVKVPLPNLGVSNTIRGAVASWAKTMSNELAPFGITVNNVLPGATRTQRLDNLLQNTAAKMGMSYEEAEEQMMNEIPMKRFGDVSELAAVAAFLASPAASYVTGVSIPVDGGKTGAL
jgi:3-oxoacyl-[acyl-carrier protein] reductase